MAKKKSSSSSTSKKKSYTYRYLEGTVNLLTTKDTLKLKAGKTVYCKGFGKYLSGKYYIQDITRTISSSGISTSATFIRMRSTSTIKSGSTVKDSHESRSYTPDGILNKLTPSNTEEPTKIDLAVVTKYHIVLKGETLRTIAKDFYGDASRWREIADANDIPFIYYGGMPIGGEIKIGQRLLIP